MILAYSAGYAVGLRCRLQVPVLLVLCAFRLRSWRDGSHRKIGFARRHFIERRTRVECGRGLHQSGCGGFFRNRAHASMKGRTLPWIRIRWLDHKRTRNGSAETVVVWMEP